MENLNLGKCCYCEQTGESVRNVITLDKKLPVKSTGGWGCFVCGLPPEGAVAVVCDDCLDKFVENQIALKYACVGDPGENQRIAVEELTETFEHDPSKHKDEIITEDERDFLKCQTCLKVTAIWNGRCSRCDQKICYICGCTESAACPGGCFWTRENICSQCDAETADQFQLNREVEKYGI